MIKKILIGMTALTFILGLLFAYRLFSEGKRSQSMPPRTVEGLRCPETPNCVSSLGQEESTVSPLKLQEGQFPDQLLNALKLQGIKVKTQNPQHWHAEFQSNIFGFVDDIDLLFEDGGVVQLRSSSRVGHSDLGANRKRVEAIRKSLASPPPP